MSYDAARVACPVCHEEHVVDEVETLDIEEDMQGRDLLTFICPAFQVETKAIVWRRR